MGHVRGSLKLCFGSQAETWCLPSIQTAAESAEICGVELQVPSRALCLYFLCVPLSKPLYAEQRIHTAQHSRACPGLGWCCAADLCSACVAHGWSTESINNPRGWGFQCLPLYHVPGSWSLLGSLPILQPHASDFSCLAHLYHAHVWDHVVGGQGDKENNSRFWVHLEPQVLCVHKRVLL